MLVRVRVTVSVGLGLGLGLGLGHRINDEDNPWLSSFAYS